MKAQEKDTFSLENFEGTIDFLVNLIQKSEIEIYDISIQQILEQYLTKFSQELIPNLEDGAEFIGSTAYLLWLKSRKLLPKHEQDEDIEEEDPKFEIIHQLIEYCQFKQAGKKLEEIEENPTPYYSRGKTYHYAEKDFLGVEHLSLDDLGILFQDVLERSKSYVGTIKEEVWLVSDKIKDIKSQLKSFSSMSFYEMFSSKKSRDELIVTFLAVLELMKLGDLKVIRENENIMVIKNG